MSAKAAPGSLSESAIATVLIALEANGEIASVPPGKLTAILQKADDDLRGKP